MLKTEMRNPKTKNIDKMDTLSMLKIINEENMNSVKAVEAELENIAKACEIAEKGFLNFFADVEASSLSDSFWNITLPQNLETSSVNSPAFNTFIAAQINLNCNSMLMNGTKISDLVTISGDVHHIFPRAYLKSNGVDNKIKYNQVANYIYLDTQVNKAISDDAPCLYFTRAKEQCNTKEIVLGNISDAELLANNLSENCIPSNIDTMDVSCYDAFLLERRKMMAALIEKYYKGL